MFARCAVPLGLTGCAAVSWAALLWSTGRERVEWSSRTEVPSTTVVEKHYVTPAQFIEAGASTDRMVGPLSAVAHDGAAFAWPGTGCPRPLVLVFIKCGCPCSAEFEPFFHRLHERYRDVVDFAGVIDAGAETARAYASANEVPFRVLADPERAIIGRLGAKNGGYVAVLHPRGHIDALWPGCSAAMMRELGRRIAALGAVPERPIDPSGIPRVLTTGCPFSS